MNIDVQFEQRKRIKLLYSEKGTKQHFILGITKHFWEKGTKQSLSLVVDMVKGILSEEEALTSMGTTRTCIQVEGNQNQREVMVKEIAITVEKRGITKEIARKEFMMKRQSPKKL